MYSFVRGARLFVKGAREPEDPDNLPDPGDNSHQDIAVYNQSRMASACQESKEVFRSAQNRSGIRTVHTSRVVRKTTTLTRGSEQKLAKSSGTQVVRELDNGTQTREHRTVRSVDRKTIEDTDVHVKRTHRTKDTTDARKKIRTNKVGVC